MNEHDTMKEVELNFHLRIPNRGGLQLRKQNIGPWELLVLVDFYTIKRPLADALLQNQNSAQGLPILFDPHSNPVNQGIS